MLRRSLLTILAIGVSASIAEAATLPLRDGEYGSGACSDWPYLMESIGLYTRSGGGGRFLTPGADGNDGYCTIGKLKVEGTRYSGTAKCTDGGKLDLPSGPYHFSYEIIDNKTFVSRGKTYRWCSEHR